MTDLNLRASVTVDNSKAVPPLKATEQAAKQTAAAMTTAGQETASAAAAATAALSRQNVVALDAVRAARQQRIAYQQLGFQISDVAAQASAGVNPMVIFAQQGGQVAQALSGLGGVVGRVAAFFAGPWGAALLGAATIAGVLWQQTRRLEEAQEDSAASSQALKESIDLLNAAMGLNISSAEALAERERVVTREKLESARATLEQLKAELQLARLRAEAVQAAGQAGFGGDAGGAAFALRDEANITRRLEEQEKAVGALTDRLLQQQSALFTKSYEQRTREAEESARRRSEAERTAARAAADAAREAERAYRQQQQALENLIQTARSASAALANPPGLFQIEEARRRATAASAIPGPDLLSASTGRISARRQAEFDVAAAEAQGRAIAEETTREMIRNSQRIGQAIGGKAGDAISKISGLANIASGDFSGAGKAGGIIGLFAGAKDILGSAKSIFTGAKDAIGGLVNGTTGILSALGPIGAAAGAIASIIGPIAKLLKPAQRGLVTLTGSGGSIQAGLTQGNSQTQRAGAETIASSFSSALSDIADRLGTRIGSFAVTVGLRDDKFTVDPSGRSRTRGSGVQSFSSPEQALAAALADALRDGAIVASPAVQTALRTYASDINKAVAEALKVQDLEDLLAAQDNPFLKVAREFERQAEERLRIARQYGFDVVAIERLNAEERLKLQQNLARDTASAARDLLDQLRFGSRAEGSVVDRLDRLGVERARLETLAAGGDTTAANDLARVIEQQLDLASEAFGSTGRFAELRAGSISTLEGIIRQAEAKVADASLQAQRQTVDKLTEANVTLDEQVAIQQRMAAALEQIAGSGGAFSAVDLSAFTRTAVA